MEKQIGFIGAGNIAKTIINGLTANFQEINKNIYITNRSKGKGESLRNKFQVNLCHTNIELVKNCDIIFLCVKPDVSKLVLREIKDHVRDDQLIISVIAGVTIDDIMKYFEQPKKVIRTMPNIPVVVREGMIALSGSNEVSDDDLNLAIDLLSSIGRVDVIEEKMMDVVTGISGCSPAFLSIFVEALADGAVLQGMPRDKAYQYIAQTLVGTGKMILEEEIHPAEIKDTVSSPGGITIAGVYALEKRGFRSTVMEVMEACDEKLKALRR
ncbi:pyrroline-5-carboxylate reductase [Alkaliphilus transvaalensis]|uniref:pyrroline-5-carboxylate reductase n=1 Tax=Alkaliphilus transvaalensis TaxID=114628 RepID=UPI000478A897|nr:pyrroline-5-carboxylate reductase [Alkaliphilus transvaalensis]